MSERKKFGDYEVLFHPKGSFTLFGLGIGKRGSYVHPFEKIRKEYFDGIEEKGVVSKIASLQIRAYGVLACGELNYIEGKKILGLPIRDDYVTIKEIVEKIKEFWAPDKVKRFQEGEDIELGGLTEFKEKYIRQYRSASRTHGGFKDILNNIYPNFYKEIHKAEVFYEDIDKEALGEFILNRFYNGLPINKTALQLSPDKDERLQFKQIMCLAEKGGGLFQRSSNYTEIVRKLTGLKRQNIVMGKSAVQKNSKLNEDMTALFFTWSFLLGIDISKYVQDSGRVVRRDRDKISFFYNDERKEADLRIGNQAIEVKGGWKVFSEKEAEDLLIRYTPGVNFWKTGELMDSSLVVFHKRRDLYEDIIPSLESAGINVLGYDQGQDLLKEIVLGMEKNFIREIEQIRPRIHNLDYIVELHKDMSLKPTLLVRDANEHKRKWGSDIVNRLIAFAEETQNGA